MTTIVTRAGKGLPLTWNEVDANFTNLNNDKAENTDVALKAPIASPTFTGTVSGITKTMVGLGNVDNTSDATKDAATATLTNKTITSPKIKAGQFGDSSTATNNFTITAEAANGTMKLSRGNAGSTTQDILTVDAQGIATFTNSALVLEVTINATQAAPALTSTTLKFLTKTLDTYNAYDTSTGEFTVPYDGVYACAYVFRYTQGTAPGECSTNISTGVGTGIGASGRFLANVGNSESVWPMGYIIKKYIAGDKIKITCYAENAGTLFQVGGQSSNFMQIMRLAG